MLCAIKVLIRYIDIVCDLLINELSEGAAAQIRLFLFDKKGNVIRFQFFFYLQNILGRKAGKYQPVC